jgi:hypothetical protein
LNRESLNAESLSAELLTWRYPWAAAGELVHGVGLVTEGGQIAPTTVADVEDSFAGRAGEKTLVGPGSA